jgi:DNA-binding transcriptional MerR regulator
MRAKEVYQILGIDRTKLRDYDRKYEVFTPEHARSDEKEAIDYTETDLYNLKRLVILNRATLTCADIKDIQIGKKSLSQAFEYRAQLIRKEYEEKMASLQFAQIIAATGAGYNDLDVDRLWSMMQGKEQEGVVFYMEDNDPRILERDVICPCCGERVLVDLEDYVADITSTDSQRDDDMGPDNVYEFDPDAPCECSNCHKCFTISGWLREYPIGAYDSDEIITIPYVEQ